MKKALKNKFTGTKKLVRKILPNNPLGSHESLEKNLETRMAEESILRHELESLNDQIANLKAAIASLQNETEQKEIAIANIAREKEKIHLDLLKTKRSNASLSKQLEEEREFYLKEKEIYCQEMNECKKMKKQYNESISRLEDKGLEEYKAEISRLKQALNQTLEANYNLSIKFLRMKNTKTCLKTELRTLKLENEKIENDFKNKIENLTTQLSDLVDDKMNWPISPSNKKYLQLLKQNSCLTYENFCLQLELDTLNYKFDKFKMEKMRTESNSRLKYIHHNTSDIKNLRNSADSIRQMHHHEIPEKLEVKQNEKPSCSKMHSSLRTELNSSRQSCSKHQTHSDNKVVKIYERKQHPDLPEIRIINEKKAKEKRKNSERIAKNRKSDTREERRQKMETISSDFYSVPHIGRSISSPDLRQKTDS